jgi:putative regulatory protein, FmdB family
MPAYEYECAQCERHFDVRQKMSDAPIAECPSCGGTVKRLISGGAGAISKGSQSQSAVPACSAGSSCCSPMGGCCGGGFCEN